MKHNKKINREHDLIARYPKLFPSSFGFECNEGWIELIEIVCRSFQHSIDNGEVKSITFAQIKEKFGLLRIYFDAVYNSKKTADHMFWKLQTFVAAMESCSSCVCEDCGKIKNKKFNVGIRKTHGFWLRTLCDRCFEKENKRVK